MVFFVCEGCNESLKKNQVDNHAARCSSCHSVTCVDCNITFHGDDYRAHTSCVSEAERYERSVYRGVKKGEEGKGNKGKKLNPQEVWNQLILEAEERKEQAGEGIRGHLVTLTSCSNVPRKEKQFRNFAANSLRLRANDPVVGEVWEFLARLREEKNAEKAKEKEEEERKKQAVKAEREAKEKEEKEKVEKKEKKEKKDKKRKATSEPEPADIVTPSAFVPGSPSKKQTTKILKKLLNSTPTQTLTSLKNATTIKILEAGFDVSYDYWSKGLVEIIRESDKFIVTNDGNVSLS
ncbi:hypothetical protein TrLO_g11386 [Triparma laevis f. longispina]|nr:hypothetical protein TrLO_g11386 [Triparma laevis f. longispina]